MRLVKSGSGVTRPLVVVYHYPAQFDDRLKVAVGESACVVNYSTRPFEKRYYEVGSKGLKSLRETYDEARAESGAQALTPIVLVGYSEGCQGVRAQLREYQQKGGTIPDAVVAVDGVHCDKPIPQRSENYAVGDGSSWDRQIAPWRLWLSDTKYGKDLQTASLFTHTEIDPTVYSSVRATLEFLLNTKLPKTTDLHKPEVTREGNLSVWGFTGTTAKDHARQAQIVLPLALNEALVNIGELSADGPERRALRELLKADVPGSSKPEPEPEPKPEPEPEPEPESEENTLVPFLLFGGLGTAAGIAYFLYRRNRAKRLR